MNAPPGFFDQIIEIHQQSSVACPPLKCGNGNRLSDEMAVLPGLRTMLGFEDPI